MGADPDRHRFYIGTYTKATSRGIYASTLDGATGAIGAPLLVAPAPNPTFIALSPDRRLLYAVCAGDSWASSFRVDPDTGGLSPIQQREPGNGPAPCHIAVDPTGRIALAANYHLGLAASLPLGADGTIGEPRTVRHTGRGPHPGRQTQAHVHSTNFSPDARYALVCDLGLDRIYTYAIDPGTVSLQPAVPAFITSAPGAGPRHLAFAKGGRHAFAINELDNTIVAYDYLHESGSLVRRQSVSLLPEGYSGDATAAEVRVHPGGRFLYGSCRGPDTISVFALNGSHEALSHVETVPCGGKGPRNFTLSPDGLWLVCAHQDSGTLCSFRVDPETGRLTRVPGTIAVSMPVCVAFLD